MKPCTLAGIGKLEDELRDLTPEEMKELQQYVAEKFDLVPKQKRKIKFTLLDKIVFVGAVVFLAFSFYMNVIRGSEF
jgi:hypothetical protein